MNDRIAMLNFNCTERKILTETVKSFNSLAVFNEYFNNDNVVFVLFYPSVNTSDIKDKSFSVTSVIDSAITIIAVQEIK